MADALFSANRMVNGNAVEIPSIGDPALPYDNKPWEAFNAKTRGESIKSAADYKFDFGKDAEGKPVEGDADMTKFAQDLAFNLGIHPRRAQELIVNPWQKFAADMNAKSVAAANAQNEQDANAVRTKWGANFETMRMAGERAVKALQLDPATLTALEAHIGAAPLMDIFAKLGKMSAEGKLLDGGNSNTTDPMNMTAEQIQQKINDKRNDAAFQQAYNDKNSPNHANVVKEMEELHRLLSMKNKPA
jgi:hypothetical protein